MTEAQKKARARFTKAQKEAKILRKKNPKLTQAQAVKQAFAIIYKKPVKKAAKKAVKKAAPKKAVKKTVRKKVNGVTTKSKTHTDYNKPTVNIQIGAIMKGSKFISYKGFLIEKKPIVRNGKKKTLFVCEEMQIVAETLAEVKRRINFLAK